MSAELVLQLLYQQKVLNPQFSPNVARACRSFKQVTDMHLQGYSYETFQNLVQKHGQYISSVEDFEYAIQHGYLVYDLSIYYLVHHRAPSDVIEYAVRKNQNRIPACAIVEAWTQDRFDLQMSLYARATDELREQANAWIADLQRKHIKYIRI
jgi:hypothetical protein